MFDDSAAKSVSMIRPVAAFVLVEMFDKLLYTWSRRLAAAPSDERTAPTRSIAVLMVSMVVLAAVWPAALLADRTPSVPSEISVPGVAVVGAA